MEYYAAWDLALAQQESASAFAESEQPDDEDRQTLTDENLRLFLCEKLGKQKKPLPQPVKKKQPPSEKTILDEMETPTEDEMEKGLQEAGPETSLQDEGGSPYADVQPHGNEESEESPPGKKQGSCLCDQLQSSQQDQSNRRKTTQTNMKSRRSRTTNLKSSRSWTTTPWTRGSRTL